MRETGSVVWEDYLQILSRQSSLWACFAFQNHHCPGHESRCRVHLHPVWHIHVYGPWHIKMGSLYYRELLSSDFSEATMVPPSDQKAQAQLFSYEPLNAQLHQYAYWSHLLITIVWTDEDMSTSAISRLIELRYCYSKHESIEKPLFILD